MMRYDTTVERRSTATGSALFLAVAAIALLLASCGSDGGMESEDYGNLLNSPAGLIVVEQEHPTGYGRPDCLVCHELRNIHAVNRTGLPDCTATPDEAPSAACLDLAAIRAIVRDQKEASCAPCHGSNGVEP